MYRFHSEDRIIETEHRLRRANHPYSQMSKAPLGVQPTLISVDIGDLVYLHADRNTSQARQCYLVTSLESDWCHIRKFISSQLRSTTYRIKRSECYEVLSFYTVPTVCSTSNRRSTGHGDHPPLSESVPFNPNIPAELCPPSTVPILATMEPTTQTPWPMMGPTSPSQSLAPRQLSELPPDTEMPVPDPEPQCSSPCHVLQTPTQAHAPVAPAFTTSSQPSPCFTSPVPALRRSTRQRNLLKHLTDFILHE